MKYALFLGCTIPARARNYELSARKVAGRLGIDLVDIEKFICCGFPIKSADLRSAMILGAYNLALAEKNGLDLCTPDSLLFLEPGEPIPDERVTTTPRVGLYTVPEPWKSIPWRFLVK